MEQQTGADGGQGLAETARLMVDLETELASLSRHRARILEQSSKVGEYARSMGAVGERSRNTSRREAGEH